MFLHYVGPPCISITVAASQLLVCTQQPAALTDPDRGNYVQRDDSSAYIGSGIRARQISPHGSLLQRAATGSGYSVDLGHSIHVYLVWFCSLRCLCGRLLKLLLDLCNLGLITGMVPSQLQRTSWMLHVTSHLETNMSMLVGLLAAAVTSCIIIGLIARRKHIRSTGTSHPQEGSARAMHMPPSVSQEMRVSVRFPY